MTLVDTNVLLDLVTNDEIWAEWSVERLEAASVDGPLLINDVVYAELSVRYDRIEALDEFIVQAGLEILPIPRAARFSQQRCLPDTAAREESARGYCLTFLSGRRLRLGACRF